MPSPALISSYHEGAENILNGRGPSIDSVYLKLSNLNPDFSISWPDPYYSVSVAQLALYLELNEHRRSGETDPRAADNPEDLNYDSLNP